MDISSILGMVYIFFFIVYEMSLLIWDRFRVKEN